MGALGNSNASKLSSTVEHAGQEVVGQLLASPRWALVTTVGRRKVTVPEQYTGWDEAKLQQVGR